MGQSSLNDTERLLLKQDLRRVEALIHRHLSEIKLAVQQQMYTANPVAFIENELKIFNPDRDPSTIPFSLYDYQKQFVQDLYAAYRAQKDILDEKSRQMGISWLYMAF